MEETAQYYEKQFFKTFLRFLSPFQNAMSHVGNYETGPLYTVYL
jgi:hypothetical protein